MRQYLHKQWPVYFIILLAIAGRLPQLLSPHFMVDGDEAIVGLMSKHFIEGKSIPCFFYGQQYGFAFVEVLAVSIGYTIAGISDYTVKLSVLALWIAGTLFLYKTLLLIGKGNKKTAMLATVIFILSPAWAVWSMKARGGYITSFLLSSIIIYLSILSTQRKQNLSFVLIGILSVVTFYSQPLWLPGIIPFVVLGIIKHSAAKRILLFFAGMVPAIILFLLIQPADSMWHPQVISAAGINSVSDVVNYLYYNQTGYYYLQNKMQAPASIASYVYVLAGITIVGIIMCIMKFRAASERHLLLTAAVSFVASLSYLFLIDLTAPRYALPFAGFTLLFLFIVFNGTKLRLISSGVTAILIVAGAIATMQFKNYKFTNDDRDLLIDASEKLKSRDINYVFSTDPLLQWHIAFYSKEAVVGRYFYKQDRYMPYIQAVDSAYKYAPGHTAILAKGIINADSTRQLNDGYAIYPAPDMGSLIAAGFQF